MTLLNLSVLWWELLGPAVPVRPAGLSDEQLPTFVSIVPVAVYDSRSLSTASPAIEFLLKAFVRHTC